jgi:DNA invertase Pin-like site-specific DNA recombinase
VSERSKLTSSHLRRQAFVYLRQSSQAQVERNVESTARQYALVTRAVELGFTREQVVVIDEDLGISGSGLSERSGFARLTAEVALGHAGLVLGLEVSRLARNNVDWYRLLDLCGVTDTVIGDADGIYHPGSFNDRLLLGLKGTMSEAELHVLRARLQGGIRNKAERGELRKALPVGLVWGEADGEILLDPDEAIRGAINVIFDRFAELGSVRQVWLWMRREQLKFPMRRFAHGEHQWTVPTYHQIHSVLDSPVYAGAYAFGKTRRERYVDEHGNTRQRMRRLPQAEWGVLIWEQHPGYIDKATFEANRARIQANTRPRAHQAGGAVREGSALLQGIAVCARCGRKLNVAYDGARGHTRPVYQCPGRILVENRGSWCMRVGGMQIDHAVADALLAALTPAGVRAALTAAEALEADHDAALSQWRLQVEQARYQAERAERRYRQVEPEHRLVARGLERDWETALSKLTDAEAELTLREHQRPRVLTDPEREQLLALGADLGRVWAAPTTTDRDRKQLLRTLIDEAILDVQREQDQATVTIRWKGGAITELAVPLLRHQPTIRTTRTRSRCSGGSPPTTTTPPSPGSSTAKTAAPRPANDSPPRSSPACATTGRSRATNHPANRPTANCSPSAKPPNSSASSPPHCTAGCKPDSSPASKTRPARPGESASTTNSAPCSSKTHRRAMCRSSTRCAPSALAARPCCSVSSAANCTPSTSATDAEKACEYWPHKPKAPCSTPPPAPERQCDDGSKQLWMSASSAHTWPRLTVVLTVSSA